MFSAPIKVTVLGSGPSMGVPSLACHCRVCTSKDPDDNRLRPSLLLSRNGQNIVIDTTPDFRQQALRAGLDRLHAILLPHHHADHILGFDDIRPFNIRQKSSLPVYSTEETFRVIRRAFAYVFDDAPTQSTVPSVDLHVVNGPFELMGVQIVSVPLLHGDLEVLGFRFGRAAYLTDFSSLPQSSAALLTDLDDLIIDALRDVPHPMHQTVEQALALVEKLKPRRAWFTHIATTWRTRKRTTGCASWACAMYSSPTTACNSMCAWMTPCHETPNAIARSRPLPSRRRPNRLRSWRFRRPNNGPLITLPPVAAACSLSGTLTASISVIKPSSARPSTARQKHKMSPRR